MTTQKITLETPIKRGDIEITTVELRKPLGGALRGCSLRALLDIETDAVVKVLPRISEPALLESECARMNGADLLQMGAVIASFLLPKAVMEEAEQTVLSQTT